MHSPALRAKDSQTPEEVTGQWVSTVSKARSPGAYRKGDLWFPPETQKVGSSEGEASALCSAEPV